MLVVMKSKKFLYIVISTCIIYLSGCSSRVQPSCNVHSELKPEDLPGVTVDSSIMPFSLLGSGMQQLHPVIKLMLDDKPYYFIIDSGASVNVFSSEEIFSKFLAEYDNSSRYKARYYCKVYSDYPYVDGILGLPFLRTHKNVVVDYNQQNIIFDSDAICDDEVPMKNLYENFCFIEFTIDGKKEYGLIDTGGVYFSLRPGFGKKLAFLDSNQIRKYLTGDSSIIRKPTHFKKHRTLCIGTVELHDVVSINGDSEKIAALPDAQRFLQVFNNLGTLVFQDHVIQLDFENQVFRIK